VGAVWFGMHLPKIRVEARKLILAQQMAGGQPAEAELTSSLTKIAPDKIEKNGWRFTTHSD